MRTKKQDKFRKDVNDSVNELFRSDGFDIALISACVSHDADPMKTLAMCKTAVSVLFKQGKLIFKKEGKYD